MTTHIVRYGYYKAKFQPDEDKVIKIITDLRNEIRVITRIFLPQLRLAVRLIPGI